MEQSKAVKKSTKTKKQKIKSGKIYTKNQILTVSALGYIIFFLPMIFCKAEPFARFHLNQSLVLWIFCTILYLAFAFIPNVNIIAIPIVILIHLLGICTGVAASIKGKANKMLVIGNIPLIKVTEQ